MGEFMKMDVFFFVTTAAVVVCTFFVSFILWQILRILRNVEHITEQVANESDIVREDLADMRDEIRQGRGRLKSLFGFMKKTTARASKKS